MYSDSSDSEVDFPNLNNRIETDDEFDSSDLDELSGKL